MVQQSKGMQQSKALYRGQVPWILKNRDTEIRFALFLQDQPLSNMVQRNKTGRTTIARGDRDTTHQVWLS